MQENKERLNTAPVTLRLLDRKNPDRIIDIPVSGRWVDFFEELRTYAETQGENLRNVAWHCFALLKDDEARNFVAQATEMFSQEEYLEEDQELLSRMFISEIKEIFASRKLKPSPGDRGDWL